MFVCVYRLLTLPGSARRNLSPSTSPWSSPSLCRQPASLSNILTHRQPHLALSRAPEKPVLLKKCWTAKSANLQRYRPNRQGCCRPVSWKSQKLAVQPLKQRPRIPRLRCPTQWLWRVRFLTVGTRRQWMHCPAVAVLPDQCFSVPCSLPPLLQPHSQKLVKLSASFPRQAERVLRFHQHLVHCRPPLWGQQRFPLAHLTASQCRVCSTRRCLLQGHGLLSAASPCPANLPPLKKRILLEHRTRGRKFRLPLLPERAAPSCRTGWELGQPTPQTWMAVPRPPSADATVGRKRQTHAKKTLRLHTKPAVPPPQGRWGPCPPPQSRPRLRSQPSTSSRRTLQRGSMPTWTGQTCSTRGWCRTDSSPAWPRRLPLLSPPTGEAVHTWYWCASCSHTRIHTHTHTHMHRHQHTWAY